MRCVLTSSPKPPPEATLSTTILVCLYGASFISANPIPSDLPWTRPCQPDTSDSDVTGSVFSASTLPVNEILASLVVTVAEARNKAIVLRDQLIQNRLGASQDRVNFLDSLNKKYIPTDIIEWSQDQTTGDVIRTYYRHLSEALVCLEVTEEDCTDINCRTNVLLHVQNLQRKILHVLCQYSSILHSLGMRIENHVTKDDMPELRVSMNSAQRDGRDYIISRDIVDLLSAVNRNQSRMNIGN